MKVEFADKKIRAFCTESTVATKELGADSFRKLRSRLSDLVAVKCVADLVFGRPHAYQGMGERRFSLDLAHGKRLIFVPTMDPPPTKSDGGIDWSLVTEVTIVFLGDNHDD